MRTRLEDIAVRAGVSVSTVSRVVNGKPGVSDQTRRNVLASLELLGYDRPAGSARLRSGLVGLIVPELDNPIFPRFVKELEAALAGEGFAPLLCTATPVVAEDEYIDMLMKRGVAGIVFVSGRHANTEVDHARYRQLRAAGVPIVLINGYVDDVDAPFVSTDDVQAMRSALAHLVTLGHRRIGCAMGPARYVTSQRKLEGYLAMSPVPEAREPSATPERGRDLVAHSIYSVEGGQTAMEALLEREVSAVVCGNDLMALGAVRAARAHGLRVPHDISVVGYDDSPMMSFTDPPLTTLRQNVPAMCRHAVGALMDEMQGIPHPRREARFPAELVVRGSTGLASG